MRAAAVRASILLLVAAIIVSHQYMDPVPVSHLDPRKSAPYYQICPGCKKTVSRSYVSRHLCREPSKRQKLTQAGTSAQAT